MVSSKPRGSVRFAPVKLYLEIARVGSGALSKESNAQAGGEYSVMISLSGQNKLDGNIQILQKA